MTEPVILLPLDGRQPALNALPVAKVFSSLGGGRLRILHVTERAPPLAQLARQLGVPAAELHGATIEARGGDPAAVILQAARELHAHLIVLSTHTKAAHPGGPLGRTALGVLQEADCPIILVNPEQASGSWALRTVLAPHEGAPTTSDALRPGAELARRAGAELIVLHVPVSSATPSVERGTLAQPAYLDQPQHEWPAWSSEFIQRLGSICPLTGLRVRLLLAHGPPAAEILRVAHDEHADLIVLVHRDPWETERAAIFEAVAKDAPCPVMVARL